MVDFWQKMSDGRRLLLVFGLAVLLRGGLLALMIGRGYLDYNADGFTRTVHAWEWAQQPNFEVGVWLPLHFWLTGGVMWLWNDIFLAPRLVHLLCSFGTLANMMLLARALFAQRAAYATVLLTAVFPWEVWFSLSGMSESVSHLLLSGALLAFVLWADSRRQRHALRAAGLLMLATMVRYEAWFYSLAFTALLFVFTWLELRGMRQGARGNLDRQVVAFANSPSPIVRSSILNLQSTILAFAFIAVWLIASTLQFGDPLAFARATSQINSDWSPTASQSDLWTRLTFYPSLFVQLAPLLSGLLIVGLIAVLLTSRSRKLAAYLSLLAIEAVLFIIISSRYNNIGAGSDRYLVSLLLFLLPCLGHLVTVPITDYRVPSNRWTLSRLAGLVVAGLLFAVPFVYLFDTTLARRDSFPERDMVQVGQYLRARFADGTLPPGSRVVVNLPPAGSDRHNAQYVFQTISNQPDSFIFLIDNPTFNAVAGTSHPRLWIVDRTAGNPSPPTGASTLTLGRYDLQLSGPQATLQVAIERGSATRLNLNGTGYSPSARVAVWLTSPAQVVTQLGTVQADGKGHIRLDYETNIAQVLERGFWAATGQQVDGGLIGVTWFRLNTAR